ncbi:uncharacterized protein LOC125036272 isoform X2 [Penaeus chinensis]|uniref:uncharacterized protein LOC125036272 isoform X2 n=1 Tax=Penaeus chinensis TaxID=139456 RepID=UPI001FB767BF|nr:uncharacterized protein LOC125036272 isoform X2 [Penaeus chinensis]XP_047484722.1 uncharacterized protein LOC125036272 isoform X2 [Penaeus chinensis]XP_047484723.1 uncharacterized protein LOC125036272 isoform X2 [Penaeus chinensis]
MWILRVMAAGMVLLVMAEGSALREPLLQPLAGNELHLAHRSPLPLENGINDDHPNAKFFQDMVDRNHELTAVESHMTDPGISEPRAEVSQGSGLPQAHETPETVKAVSEGAISTFPRPQTKKVIALLLPRKAVSAANKPHSRQKRFLSKVGKLRTIVVPLSIFNFLGFLPMRVPGLPYHDELPPPDYTYYNTIHELPQKRYKYFQKYY